MEQAGFRTEQDSLGAVPVPVGALYGAQTQRAVENFQVSGLRPRFVYIESLAQIKKAAASVNAELGLLSTAFSAAIIRAADEVIAGKWTDQFVVDPFQAGAGTSQNMNMNEVLAGRATQLLPKSSGSVINPNDHVNMAQSTNDVIPTAIRLGCLIKLDEITRVLSDLEAALNEKAAEFDPIVKSGRTHLQDAVPVRLGQEFGAYAAAVRKDRQRILEAAEALRELGIGGTAVGSGMNAHPDYHARMIDTLVQNTGISLRRSENLFERMQSLADLASFSAALRTTALTLIRIANDFRLLSSGPETGLDEIRLPALQPGSSIMPGKINPVMAEMLDMAMFHVIGCDTTVSLAVQAGQLELNVMMPVIAYALFEAIQVLTGSVRVFTEKCVRGILANPAKAAHWLEKNPIIVTALNPLIGYLAGAALVKEAATRNCSIAALAREKAEKGELIRKDNGEKISAAEVERIFSDLHKMTEGGIFA